MMTLLYFQVVWYTEVNVLMLNFLYVGANISFTQQSYNISEDQLLFTFEVALTLKINATLERDIVVHIVIDEISEEDRFAARFIEGTILQTPCNIVRAR